MGQIFRGLFESTVLFRSEANPGLLKFWTAPGVKALATAVNPEKKKKTLYNINFSKKNTKFMKRIFLREFIIIWHGCFDVL